jgi:hypothetical protein
MGFFMIWVVRVRYARVMNPDPETGGCTQDQDRVFIICEPWSAGVPSKQPFRHVAGARRNNRFDTLAGRASE